MRFPFELLTAKTCGFKDNVPKYDIQCRSVLLHLDQINETVT